jgi:Peptidase inhibitor family I36
MGKGEGVRKTFSILLVMCAAIASIVLMAPGSAGAAPALARTPDPWRCSPGFVCFYSGKDGTGDRCQWQFSSRDWSSGEVTCDWAGTKKVVSVYNRSAVPGTAGVAYYAKAGYKSRVGCQRQGVRGNLEKPRKLRSHRWVRGTC